MRRVCGAQGLDVSKYPDQIGVLGLNGAGGKRDWLAAVRASR
jgi:hypothetical protein